MAAISQNLPSAPPAQGGAFKLWWQRTANTRAAYLYLLPAFIVMGIITFYPMGYQIWMSFTDYGVQSLNPNSATYKEPQWVGVQNYSDIFKGDLAKKIPNFSFWRLLGFNLIWTFANVPVHVVLGVLIAVLLNQPGLWFKRAYRAIYVLPMVIPTLVVAAVWKNMYDPSNGAINQLLKSTFEPLITFGQANLGLFADINLKTFFQIRWFAQIDPPFGLLPGLPLPLSFYAMLIANIWLGWPFMTIVATGALQSVPGDLYEAAALDGASGSQQFFQITVPLIRPAMVPAAMLGIITTFNLFNFVYLMSGGGPLRQTEIMVTTAYSLVKANQLYGMAAGFCVIIFFVLLGLTLLTNAITKGTERYDI